MNRATKLTTGLALSAVLPSAAVVFTTYTLSRAPGELPWTGWLMAAGIPAAIGVGTFLYALGFRAAAREEAEEKEKERERAAIFSAGGGDLGVEAIQLVVGIGFLLLVLYLLVRFVKWAWAG